MDEKEEGEISLEDVSSSEETNHNNWMKKTQKSNMDRKHDKRVEVDILPQDAVYGKENRQFSNELHTPEIKSKPPTLEDHKDGLLPISSDEEVEIIGLPGSSERLLLNCGPKRKKKKKKKKKSGPRLLVMDDLESTIEVPLFPARITGDDINPMPRGHYGANEPIHKKYSPTSGKLYRSPVKHIKAPFHHPRSPSPRRRSPRRLSPVRSSAISDRHSQYKSTRDHSPRHDKTYSLLKKVRSYDNKHKETSLKDKLFSKTHVLKSDPENYSKESKELENCGGMKEEMNDDEDEDQLRRAALETTLQKTEKIKDIDEVDETNAESEDNSSGINYNAGDQDEEDLQLRMIALKSAVLKKHHDRVQRGVVRKNKNVDNSIKSPSNDSFLDLINDDHSEDGHSSPDDLDAVLATLNVEDMDLDSDVEREKENQPYSPTDELSNDKYLETSKVTTESSNGGVPFDSYHPNATASPEFTNTPVSTFNQEFYPQTNQIVNLETPYSPSDPTRTPKVDRYLRPDQFNYTASYLRPALPPRIGAIPTNSRAQTPYSPTDTPVFDPELPVCPSELSFVDNSINSSCVPYPNSSYLDKQILRPYNDTPEMVPPPILEKSSMPAHFSRDPRRAAALSRGEPTNSNQIHKPIPTEQELIKNLEKPKEAINADPRLHKMTYVPNKNSNDDRFDEIVKSLEEYTTEPAYLQGVPQVTKDANKIPTLVNRTLVPVPILKTNKQLQQKLPTKKVDDSVEKTFKNADMQPVEIDNKSKPNSLFKPIKLQPNVRKIQLIPIPTKGFNGNSANDSSADKNLENSGVVDLSNNTETLTKESEVKKRGRGKPKIPTIRKNTVKKTPTKENSAEKVYDITKNKSLTRGSGKRSSKENDEAEKSEKSIEDGKSNEAKKPGTRGRRSKSVPRSDKKDESELNKKNKEDNRQKRESFHRAVKGKTLKASETSLKKNDIICKEADKKRRLSADEDEEALRASLIASLSKRSKQADDLVEKKKIDSIKVKQLTKNTTLSEKPDTSTLKNNSTPLNSVNNVTFNDKQKSSSTRVTSGNALNPLLATRKRASMTEVFGPPEKILKKATVISKNTVDNLVKNSGLSASSKMMSSKNVSRVVINLGEDTDTDSESSDSSTLSSMKKSNNSAPVSTVSDFTKKLDEFLKSQREKLETNSASSKVTPTGSKAATLVAKETSALTFTPLAVRHLSPEQQEEYRKLKLQLVEIEKKKSMKKSTKTATSKSTESAVSFSAKNEAKRTIKASKPAQVTSTSSLSISSDKLTTLSSGPSRTNENQLKSTAQELLTNIPRLVKKSSSATSASENLQSLIKTYSLDNTFNISSTDEQQLLFPTDFSIKSDPNDLLTVFDEPKRDPAIVEIVSQKLSDEIDYNVPLESLGMRENLIIQISNIRDDNMTNHRKVRIGTDANPAETTCSTQAAPVLRILTTAQLNMKLEQVPPSSSQEENEEKVLLDESGQIIVQDIRTIENAHCDNTLASQITTEVAKTEPISESSEQITPTVQTTIEESATVLTAKTEPEAEPPNETEPVNQLPGEIKSEAEDDLDTYLKLPIEDQKAELAKMENNLVKKRYVVLSDVTDFAENLQQWEVARDAQLKLNEEVKRLKLELMMAQERLEEQKAKLNNMGPKITKAHGMINKGRNECFKLTMLCQGIGNNISGTDYKLPNHGDQALTDKLNEVRSHTQQLSRQKKSMSKNNNGDNNSGSVPSSSDNSHIGSSKSQMSNSNEQSTPLNLSVQITSETKENSSIIKTEDPINQDLNTSSSATPVQPELNVNQNQQTQENVLLTRIKSEPVEVNETEDFENTLVETIPGGSENERVRESQLLQENIPITQVKTERIEVDENNESVLICENAPLKSEKDDTKSVENTSDVNSTPQYTINSTAPVITSECLDNRRVEEEKTKEGNVVTTDVKTESTDINNKPAELDSNISLNACEKNISKEKEKVGDEQINNTDIKIETTNFPTSSKKVSDADGLQIVGQASQRSAEAVASNAEENWGDLEEEKPAVTGVSYESVLTAFNITRPLDPNRVLCPYELMGTCNDDSCTYNHLDANRKT